MPIQTLTDTEALRPRLPRLGKLRKGGEKTATGFGTDLDHFRFTGATPEIQAAFDAVFSLPRSIIVYLPYQTLAECFETWCEVWSASGLDHRCDGVNAFIWRDTNKMITGSKPCPGGHEKDDPKKDAVGRLHLVVPQLLQAGHVGVVTLETHSINDIVYISSVLAYTQERRGDLRGIAFRLYRVQEEISVPGWGERQSERAKTKKWLVKIEPAAEWVRHQLAQAYAEALSLPPASETVAPDTGEIITETKQLLPPTQPVIRRPTPAIKPNGNGSNAKTSAKTWQPQGSAVAPILFGKDSWRAFCDGLGADESVVTAALGTVRVSEWLAKESHRSPDGAAALVAMEIWRRLFVQAREDGRDDVQPFQGVPTLDQLLAGIESLKSQPEPENA